MDPHTEIAGGGPFMLPAGAVTDETEMAMCLADSLLRRGRFDAEDVAHEYVEWLHGSPVEVEPTVLESLREIARGTPIDAAAARVHARFAAEAASGVCIARAAPLALRYRDDAASLVDATLADARLTHFESMPALAAVFANLLISAFLSGSDVPSAVAAARASVEHQDGRLDATLSHVDEGRPPQPAPRGSCAETLHAALWCLTSEATFERALVRAVNLGGEADTTGALAGALAGALHGLSSIPARWLAVLRPRERLETLALRLVSTASPAAHETRAPSHGRRP